MSQKLTLASCALKTELKDYQEKTVEWMISHENKYDGGMLLHHPGLGKTVISLALVCKVPLKTLVIVNGGLIDNWMDEIKKHTNISKERIVKYYGPGRQKNVEKEEEIEDKNKKEDKLIYISSYSIVSREYNNGEFDNTSIFSKIKFDRIILDEAHYIRNASSMVHKSMMYLGEQNIGIKKWVVTATPIFNDPSDMYAYFKFLNLEGIDSKRDWSKSVSKNVNGLHTLNNWIEKYSLSYKKEDVLKELKSKNEQVVKLKFSELELQFYNSLKEYSVSRMKRLVSRIKTLKKNPIEGMRQVLHTNVMVYILRLKQACNSPWLVLNCMERLKGINDMKLATEHLSFYNDNKNIEEECPICYDKLADYIADPCGHKCCKGCWDRMFNACIMNCPSCRSYVDEISCTGDDEQEEPVGLKIEMTDIKETAKIKYTIQLIKDVIEKDEKIIIVSQWVKMLEIVRNILDELSIKHMSLQGNISMENRTRNIKEFQTKKDIKVCLISLMASAEGINLTSANHLIILDQWYNESKMIQVADRTHRIGQLKQANIYNLQIENTIEQQIEKLVKKKSKISKLVLDKWNIDLKSYDSSWMNKLIKLLE